MQSQYPQPYPQGEPGFQQYAPAYPQQQWNGGFPQPNNWRQETAPPMMIPQNQAGKNQLEKQTNLLVDKTSIERMKKQFAMSLPSFYTVDRFIRACFNVLNAKNPKDFKTVQLIRQSTPESFFGCLLACASLGLEPNGPLGHAYIIPFQNWQNGQIISVTCQLVVGYKGLIDLARRSGNVQTIIAHEVRQNDYFKFNFGTGELPVHTFDLQADRGEIIAVYAVARFADNSYHFDLMTKSEVDRIRNGSKSKNSDPWKDHYDEMAKKTIIRRIAKYLPMDVQKAAAYDGASLKYDPTTDTETGLLFDGYIDVDAAAEDGTNTPEEQPGAPQEETPRLVTPQGAVPPTNKAQEAAASIKSSVAGRRTRRTVAKQPEPVEPSTESAPESPQPENAAPATGYTIHAAEFGTQAGLCENKEQFESLVNLLNQTIQEGKFDPAKKGLAFHMILEVAQQQGIDLPVPPDLQAKTADDIPW